MIFIMKLFLIILLLSFSTHILSQTSDENSSDIKLPLETLKEFFPENKFDAKNPKINNALTLLKEDKKETLLIKYSLDTHPLVLNIQTNDAEISDLYIRFANNFLHNIALKKIHEMFGKHQRTYTKESNRLFFWKESNFDGKSYEVIYHASCSISCFPMGLYIISKKAQKDSSFISLYQKFNKDFPRGAY